MTKTATSNFTGCASPGSTFNKRISADSDAFDRNDIDSLGSALDEHDHSLGKGLPAVRIGTSGAPVSISGTPSAGQALIATSATAAAWSGGTLGFANVADNGKKLQFGSTSHAFVSATSKTVSVVFTTGFGSTPTVVASVSSATNLTFPKVGNVTTAGFDLTLYVVDITAGGTGGTTISSTETATWIAVG